MLIESESRKPPSHHHTSVPVLSLALPRQVAKPTSNRPAMIKKIQFMSATCSASWTGGEELQRLFMQQSVGAHPIATTAIGGAVTGADSATAFGQDRQLRRHIPVVTAGVNHQFCPPGRHQQVAITVAPGPRHPAGSLQFREGRSGPTAVK